MPLAAVDSHHGGGSSSSSSSNPNAGAPSDDDPTTAAAPTAVAHGKRPESSPVAAAAAAAAAALAADPDRNSTDAAAAAAAGAGATTSTAAPRISAVHDYAPPSPAKPATPPSIHSSTSNASASRAAALLSRLNLPSFTIRSRNRNVLDFHIRPDEPHKTYSAGDTVRGHVNVAIIKPIRITHLVVALHGYIHVFKDASAKAKASGSPVAPRGGVSQLPQYHGNGLASLFQDEQVLAGEGRLEAGRYEFGFELIFPDIGLPSSIDFERGTVSYMLTATLTRPTAIAPTVSCDKRVLLVEKIDIGHLPPPRSRTIFLEPISKRTRRKRSAVFDKAPAPIPEPPSTGVPNDHTSEAGSVERAAAPFDSARDAAHPEHNRGPTQIDVRSEVSGESARSISTAVSRSDVTPLSHVSAFKSPSKQKIVDNKTITATIELLKGGCLAGDMVSIRVSVQHIKRLKSLTGVIVTLFRQSKIDSAPAASLFSGNDLEAIGDDGYPRSRTGLAGLSLSSTSSTSMFRKDLDQNTAPLIIDPSSLYASVTCSLKLPDDAFPTIRGVPGAMVSFRYHIEVIVDLGGKLSSQMLQGGQQSTTRLGQYMTSGQDSAYGPRVATNIIDTAPLRRQKGVVSVSMETVVGTVDSSRRRKPLRISPRHLTPRVPESDEDDAIRAELNERPALTASPVTYTTPPPSERHYASQPPLPHSSRANASSAGPSQPDYHAHSHLNGYSREAAPAYIPQPQLPNSRTMSEKERIQQAETRLLPSQPPATGPSSAPASAPAGDGDDNIYDAQEPLPRQPLPSAGPSAPTEDEASAGPSAPSEEDLNGTAAYPAEDKQELERQRLIIEASAPPEFPEDMERPGDASALTEADAEPSAPILDEDEEELAGYGVGAGPSTSAGPSGSSGQRTTGEQLPAYQR